MYNWQIEEVADIQKDSIEALIMAAQKQALSTRSIEAGVHHTRPQVQAV